MKKIPFKILKALLRSWLLELEADPTTEIGPVKRFQKLLVQNIGRIADIMTDRDKNNRDQLQELWIEERRELASVGLDIAREEILQKLKDPETREIYEAVFEDLQERINPSQPA